MATRSTSAKLLHSHTAEADPAAPRSAASRSVPSDEASRRARAAQRIMQEEKQGASDESPLTLQHGHEQYDADLRERAVRMMLGRVQEAKDKLTYTKIFELRERERAVKVLRNEQVLRRDIQLVRKRLALQGRWVLDPAAWYMQAWDMLMLSALLWTVWVTPYEIGFLPSPGVWNSVANALVTSLFGIDMPMPEEQDGGAAPSIQQQQQQQQPASPVPPPFALGATAAASLRNELRAHITSEMERLGSAMRIHLTQEIQRAFHSTHGGSGGSGNGATMVVGDAPNSGTSAAAEEPRRRNKRNVQLGTPASAAALQAFYMQA